MAPFDTWENFYVIVGSSAGALTGLQFVVMALISESRSLPRSRREVDAFATPTVVHFCAVLLLSAIVSARPRLDGCWRCAVWRGSSIR
jgi:hypothetical protein